MFDGASGSAYAFQREKFSSVIDEAREMLGQQWIEAGEGGVGELRLSEDRYNAMDALGMLRIVTVRHLGKLIGYASIFVFSGMHADAKAMVSDALYLLPAHRRPGVSMRLVRYVEAMGRDEGVNVIHWQANSRFPGFGRLLQFMGYPPISSIHAKVLQHA